MRYQAVHWKHEIYDEPVLLYSEIDCSGREIRKVEEYRSGRLDVAGADIETGSTRLSGSAIPPLAEIDAMDDFSAEAISAQEFEAIWRRALDWFDVDD